MEIPICPRCGKKLKRCVSEYNFAGDDGVIYVVSNMDRFYECDCYGIFLDKDTEELLNKLTRTEMFT